jgi:hypothetical protein
LFFFAVKFNLYQDDKMNSSNECIGTVDSIIIYYLYIFLVYKFNSALFFTIQFFLYRNLDCNYEIDNLNIVINKDGNSNSRVFIYVLIFVTIFLNFEFFLQKNQILNIKF